MVKNGHHDLISTSLQFFAQLFFYLKRPPRAHSEIHSEIHSKIHSKNNLTLGKFAFQNFLRTIFLSEKTPSGSTVDTITPYYHGINGINSR